MQKVRAKKHFGQHFLKDLKIAERIAQIIPENTKNVLEIGSGMGVLTQFLLENQSINFKAVEIDSEATIYLNEHFPRLDVINGNFLKMDLEKIFNGEKFVIIGNFPYNISSQIFFKAFNNRHLVTFVGGMLQKEVAERICAPAGSKTYGILSVLLQAYYDAKYLFGVSEHVFEPPPKVKSAVVALSRNATPSLNCDEREFAAIVKTAFNQRRKTLRNSLKKYAENQSLTDKIFDLRPEQLTFSQFEFLTNLILVKN
ncbi:MAG: 16S rRNA (adenine(1518)-N(6)/adenine(1519)-N(6))-dimethyltransferase RsmA [Prevotellaceae bacterium]|jgi:16S rRNA (adenine1518-N6/adenine1519-N6)-dimethyltransferase|nr:16S rRNA (adenine(1518)-N(6)/adenine(1519)-N(6))-dimethyltransferase RsmA [Prevotellaceae bacterium]